MRKYCPLLAVVVLLLCNIVAFSQSSGSAVKPEETIDEKNKRLNETVRRTFTAGNTALMAKNYDEAIKQYDEGLTADPEHPGAPLLLTNKSLALRWRGVARLSAAWKAEDAARKADDFATKDFGLQAAKDDIRLAVETGKKAVDAIRGRTVPTDPAALTSHNSDRRFALAARWEATRVLAQRVDESKASEAFAAYQEYVEAETDPARKEKAHHDVAEMLRDTKQYDKAVAEYEEILAQHPNDLDAILGAALSLYDSSDKSRCQQAANYLQRFLDVAPATHEGRETIKSLLDILKKDGIVPQKIRP